MWTITYQDSMHIVLGEGQPDDDHRIAVYLPGPGDDEDNLLAVPTYPCHTCGWADACGGECHS